MSAVRTSLARLWLSHAPGLVIIFAVLYVHVLWVLDPRLFLHGQAPAFFVDKAVFLECIRFWPGGLVEYLSAGLTQLYAYPPLGALVLTVAVGLICAFTGRLLRVAFEPKSVNEPDQQRLCCTSHLLAFVPILPLLVLLNRYMLPLSAVAGLCVVLGTACLVSLLGRRRAHLRIPLVMLTCAALYALTGGVSMLFALLCALLELLVWRSIIAAALIAITGALAPYLIGTYVYQLSLRDIYLRLDSFHHDYCPPWTAITLYACFPMVLIIAKWLSWSKPSRRPTDKAKAGTSGPHAHSPRGWCLRLLAVLAAGTVTTYAAFDSHRCTALTIDYHTRAQRWDKALEAARPFAWAGFVPGREVDEKMGRPHSLFQFPADAHIPTPQLMSYNVAIHNINLALAQTGRLLDDLFRYPQQMAVSIVRLLPDSEGAYVAHSYNIDVLLELGDVNDAQRVAGECLANVGPRPWVLERMAMISVLKKQPETARVCLTAMSRDPRSRASAERLLDTLGKDPTLASQPQIQRVRPRMYRETHVGQMFLEADGETLRNLLVQNPHNRLAFDYLMASDLLNLRYDQVVRNVQYLKEFGYQRIPRHCEEAILFHTRFHGSRPDLRGFQIRPETTRRFESFCRDVDTLGGPGERGETRVRDALVTRYADTYWFYVLFGETFFGRERLDATSQPEPGP